MTNNPWMGAALGQFTWVALYHELADELSKWEDRQTELISFLEELRRDGYVITPLQDRDAEGRRFLLQEIDPFTFFGVFNRRISYDQRLAILTRLKQRFGLQSDLPDDFDGVPLLNNPRAWFFPARAAREPQDIARLWRVFQKALGESPLKDEEFLEAFDQALKVKRTNVNLSLGLYWIRPDRFLSLDQNSRAYLGLRLPAGGLTAQFYADAVKLAREQGKSFPEIVLAAWGQANERRRRVAETREARYRAWGGVGYWLVGAYWDDRRPPDQTERFLEEGIWENGYGSRYVNDILAMRVNDRIAIKAVSTQRAGLPFEGGGRSVPRMTIKAIGTVVANRGDGQTVEVEWDPTFKEKTWYFYTNPRAVWRLRTAEDDRYGDYNERLRDFVWHDREQEYAWFLNRQLDASEGAGRAAETLEVPEGSYGLDDLVAAGVFLAREELEQILSQLRLKKAIILQGPPGVGKTFLSRRLAYALIKEVDDDRLGMVQFHQSYSYDDFVRGYRPAEGQPGGFVLKNGIFYEFCQRATQDAGRDYVFIIDEINRGNLSQIFGELLMLLEADKRGPGFAIPLAYRSADEPPFFVPPNLYLIGLMNAADRSLAMVDYAMRRRFAFINLRPQYGSELFRDWLAGRGMDPGLIVLIVERMSRLNREIREDPLLGENYELGHSYFLPQEADFTRLDKDWYRRVVQSEILPLLKEYWFDNPRRLGEAEIILLS